jgi:predicted alpha/beta-fold hydrolase
MWLITLVIILYKILGDFVLSYFSRQKPQPVFKPPKYAWLSYAQTFLIFFMYEFKNIMFVASDLVTTREHEPIFLEWMSLPTTDKSPVVLLMHGIGGCSDSCYIKAWVTKITKYSIVVLNRPGYHSSHPLPETCKRYPTFCDPHILEYAIDHISSKYENNPIYIIGYSAGGLHTFKYAASSKRHKNVKGVVGVSVCYEMIHMLNYLEKNKWMNEFMGILIMDMFRINPKVFPLLQKYKRGGQVTDIIKHFLKDYMGNTMTIEKYLVNSSCHEEMSDPNCLNIPSLCIQSRDDMFFPTDVIEKRLETITRRNNHVNTIITEYGGHVSWIDENHEIWVIKCISDFIDRDF